MNWIVKGLLWVRASIWLCILTVVILIVLGSASALAIVLLLLDAFAIRGLAHLEGRYSKKREGYSGSVGQSRSTWGKGK